MTEFYKGKRIEDLLADIRRLEGELYKNEEVATSAEDVVALVSGQATLAIAKAKLTALLGDYK